MQKKRIIIISIAAAVALLIAVVALTQWSRLRTVASVAKSATMNEEQTTAKSVENEQIVQEVQDQYQIPDIQLTPEMQAAIADGSMTLEEAASQLLSGGLLPETDTTSPEPDTTAPESDTTSPESDTTTSPEPEAEVSVPAVTPEPEPEVSVPVTPIPEPEPDTTTSPEPEISVPVATPEPTPDPETPVPVVIPEPEPEAETSVPVATPEPDPAPAPEEETAVLSGETEAPQPSEAETAAAEKEARVQNLFAQLYVLQSSFNTKLDNLINECITEFLALPVEKQTKATKIRIVYAKMDTIDAMEADCDAQVENIASQLDELAPDLAAKARQYYKNEKELKKASLIAQYGQ